MPQGSLVYFEYVTSIFIPTSGVLELCDNEFVTTVTELTLGDMWYSKIAQHQAIYIPHAKMLR